MNAPKEQVERMVTIAEMQHAEIVLRIAGAADNLVEAFHGSTKDRRVSTIAALMMAVGIENEIPEVQKYINEFKVMKAAEAVGAETVPLIIPG